MYFQSHRSRYRSSFYFKLARNYAGCSMHCLLNVWDVSAVLLSSTWRYGLRWRSRCFSHCERKCAMLDNSFEVGYERFGICLLERERSRSWRCVQNNIKSSFSLRLWQSAQLAVNDTNRDGSIQLNWTATSAEVWDIANMWVPLVDRARVEQQQNFVPRDRSSSTLIARVSSFVPPIQEGHRVTGLAHGK